MEKKDGKKKKAWLCVVIVLVLVIVLLLWWFLRTFEVTFKYNNGDEDKVVKVRYINVIKKEDVRENLEKEGYTFAGYYETYYLDGEAIASIKSDSKKEETICKEGFKLDSEKVKCVAEKEFDFENTKITEKKTIEALWSKKSDDNSVKISASANCAIGTNSITLTAKTTGDVKVKEWSIPHCYTNANKATDSKIKLTRNGNCPNEVDSDTVKVTLTNGKTASYTLKYEPKLKLEAYRGNAKASYSEYADRYEGERVESNIKVKWSIINNVGKILSSSDTSVTVNTGYNTDLKATTSCQSATIKLYMIIN